MHVRDICSKQRKLLSTKSLGCVHISQARRKHTRKSHVYNTMRRGIEVGNELKKE